MNQTVIGVKEEILMDISRRRNIVSVLVIVAMVASIFTLPLLNDDYVVNAATKKVKVTFKTNGGKFTEKKYAKKKAYFKKIKKGKKIGKLPKVKRADYKFKGWYTKKSGGKKVTKNTKIKKKTTLYARWEKIKVDAEPSECTKEEYNKITKEMEFSDVVELIGGEPFDTVIAYDYYNNVTQFTSKWYAPNKSGTVTVIFYPGKTVKSKTNSLGW